MERERVDGEGCELKGRGRAVGLVDAAQNAEKRSGFEARLVVRRICQTQDRTS